MEVDKDQTYIADQVRSGHEGRRVGCEEHREVVELVNRSETVHGSALLPEHLLGIERRDAVELRIHVPRGDRVDADIVLGPFRSKGLSKVNNTGFGGVVTALLLRPVDDMGAHGPNENDRTSSFLLDHVAASSLGANKRTVKVDVDEATEHVSVVVLGGDVRTMEYVSPVQMLLGGIGELTRQCQRCRA